jgi:catechol 2,3-dioxygenase-like lactoylglutathione lyase family enzyme
MGYHHLALLTRDIGAIHDFYENVMGFELVKVEVQPHGDGWAKHFFYRMEDDSKFIAFWELHQVPGADDGETNLSKAAGVPDGINHIAFDVHSREELDERRAQWQAAGLDVLEIDHNWCRSIYAKDPNGNTVEFCLTTGAFDAADRERALEALTAESMDFSDPPGAVEHHRALKAAG